MKELLQKNRIRLSKNYLLWSGYYFAPGVFAFSGTQGLFFGLYKGESFNQLYPFAIFAAVGWSLLYWLDRQLHFKNYPLEGSVDNLRARIYSELESNGWSFKNKTQKYAIATKGKELLVVKFESKSYKVCLTGNFILLGPLLSIIPYYPHGKKILKNITEPNDTHTSK